MLHQQQRQPIIDFEGSLETFYLPWRNAGGHSLQPSAIKHDLYDDGEYAELESGARCHNCGEKTVSCLLFVGPETYKLSGRGGSGRGDARAGPRKQK